MAIPPITPSAEPPRTPDGGPEGVQPAEAIRSKAFSNREATRQEINIRILQSSLEVSIRAGDQAQALLFRAAVDSINDRLAPVLGPKAVDSTMEQDFSPQAVAGRILSFATGFFEAYATQRPDDDPGQVTRDFVELIRGGFEQGFNEAREILEGLGVFSGEVESGVMKTYTLFMQGLDAFLADRLGPADETSTERA